jgi:hypothetical protein
VLVGHQQVPGFPTRPGATHPPTPDELAEFVTVATKYGYDLGTLEQNAAVGIALNF